MPGSTEDLIKISILQDENKSFQIGVSMPHEDRVKVLLLLVQSLDVFAWSPYEVPEVDPEFITHWLNMDSSYLPKK